MFDTNNQRTLRKKYFHIFSIKIAVEIFYKTLFLQHAKQRRKKKFSCKTERIFFSYRNEHKNERFNMTAAECHFLTKHNSIFFFLCKYNDACIVMDFKVSTQCVAFWSIIENVFKVQVPNHIKNILQYVLKCLITLCESVN